MWPSQAAMTTPAQAMPDQLQATSAKRMARGADSTLTTVAHHANSRMSITTVISAVLGSDETRPDAAPAAMNSAAGMTYGARSLRCVPTSQTIAVTMAAMTSKSTGELLPGPVGCSMGWKMMARTSVTTAVRWALPRASGAGVSGSSRGGLTGRIIVSAITGVPSGGGRAAGGSGRTRGGPRWRR